MSNMIQMYDPKREYQSHKQEIDDAIHRVLDHGIFIGGPEIKELEKQLAEYVDVKHSSCKFGDCIKRPTFGNNGGKAIYCKEHKQDDNVDVLNKRCEYLNCNKYPNYGIVSGIALSCLDHKKDNYIRSLKIK